MRTRRQLQCKALRELEKSRRRKNNAEQWKEQCESAIETTSTQPELAPLPATRNSP
jgi:hypothetical protein